MKQVVILDDVNAIVKGLEGLPYCEAAPLINKIREDTESYFYVPVPYKKFAVDKDGNFGVGEYGFTFYEIDFCDEDEKKLITNEIISKTNKNFYEFENKAIIEKILAKYNKEIR